MTKNKKEYFVSYLLDILGSKEKPNGYYHIRSALIRIWNDRNYNWCSYDKYFSIIALEERLSEQKVIKNADEYISDIWFKGDKEIIKIIFGSEINYTLFTGYNLFLRTVLSILFYCEEHNVDLEKPISDIKTRSHNKTEYLEHIILGYLVLIRKNFYIPEIIEAIKEKTGNNSPEAALFSYIKHTSILFATVIFDDIVIPPELYGCKIRDLRFADKNNGVRVTNILYRNDIVYLKDLCYTDCREIKKIKGLGEKGYKCFYEALKKSVDVRK